MLKLPSKIDIVWLVLYHLLVRVMTQAPGDEDDFCTSPSIYVVPHVYPPNMNVLMDSHNYNNLLPTFSIPGASVWQEVGVDTQQTQWSAIRILPCRHLLSSCNFFDHSSPINGIATQHISKPVQEDSLLSQVNVLIEFQLEECIPNCQASFTLSVWETSKISREARNISLYTPVQTIVPSIFHRNNSNASIPVNFATNETGFYLVITISNTCIRISRVMAFYTVCPAIVLDLMEYPQTIPPEHGSSGQRTILVKGQCVKGASERTRGSLFIHCAQGGHWVFSQNGTGCQCDQGFVTSRNGSSCLACPAGQYLSSNVSLHCRDCPLNTRLDESAVTVCQCVRGYFRALHESAHSSCTTPPDNCKDLEVISISETSILVQWYRPNITGRSDFYYKIFYRDVTEGGNFVTITNSYVNASHKVQYEIEDLNPSQTYQIRVSTHNDVSDQDSDNERLRWCEVLATTLQVGLPSECRNLVVTSTSDRDVVIQWNRPRILGERYFYYKILYSDLNSPGQYLTHNSSLVNSDSMVTYQVTNLIPFQKYRLRVTTHNNVSDKSPDQYTPKYCEVTASTRQKAPNQVTEVRAFCSVVVWEEPTLMRGDFLYYQLFFQPLRKAFIVTSPFYITSEEDRIPGTTVQVQAVNGAGQGPYSNPISIGCQDVSTSCPSINATPSPPTNTTNYFRFELKGKTYLNDTVVVMEDIGEDHEALLCFSTYDSCCYTGEFFYPNGSEIPIGSHGFDLYRNRGKGLGFIRLNRRRNVASPEGRYRCMVPIGNGQNENLFINIISRQCPDPLLETTCPPCAGCPPATSSECPTCPAATPCPQSTESPITTASPTQASPTTLLPTSSSVTTPEVTTPLDTTAPVVTTDPPPVLYFELKGQVYRNNSILNAEDIGENEDALRCVSENNALCCNKVGDFYYPNGTRIPGERENHSFWRNRGKTVDQPFVRLHRRSNRRPVSGAFRCEIPFEALPRQRLYVTVI